MHAFPSPAVESLRLREASCARVASDPLAPLWEGLADATAIVCLEGEVEAQDEAQVEGASHHLAPNDVLVVPSWHTLQLQARATSVLFSDSNCPVQQALGRWREERV